MNTTPSQATANPTTSGRVEPTTSATKLEIQGSSVRVDARSGRSRGPRAQVLKAYAEWLQQASTRITSDSADRSDSSDSSRFSIDAGTTTSNDSAAAGRHRIAESLQSASPASSPPSDPSTESGPSMIGSAETRTLSTEDREQIDRLFHRIDTAIEQSLNEPIVKQSPPHFETRNYVPPVEEQTTESVTGTSDAAEWSERDQAMADRSRDPGEGIVEHIRELQSQGRMIGDLKTLQQLEHARVVQHSVHGKPLPTPSTRTGTATLSGTAESDRIAEPQPCAWPEVTDLLLTRHRAAIDALAGQVDSVLGPGQRRVAVTCTRRREGASTIAMSLARCYCETGARVLLVDADLTHPDLIAKLTPDCVHSWTRALDNPKQLRNEITTTISSQVDLLPLFRLGDNTRWKRPILGHLGDALRRIESNYDRVIINTGPVFQLITEIRSADDLADAFILVTAVNRTTDAERQQSQNGLLSVGADKILVAQNFTRR